MADTKGSGAQPACNDSCGCPSPCPGGASCRCTASERSGHKKCSCGDHCGCNPCTCTKMEGTGKAFCKCGSGCTCATCSA